MSTIIGILTYLFSSLYKLLLFLFPSILRLIIFILTVFGLVWLFKDPMVQILRYTLLTFSLLVGSGIFLYFFLRGISFIIRRKN